MNMKKLISIFVEHNFSQSRFTDWYLQKSHSFSRNAVSKCVQLGVTCVRAHVLATLSAWEGKDSQGDQGFPFTQLQSCGALQRRATWGSASEHLPSRGLSAEPLPAGLQMARLRDRARQIPGLIHGQMARGLARAQFPGACVTAQEQRSFSLKGKNDCSLGHMCKCILKSHFQVLELCMKRILHVT